MALFCVRRDIAAPASDVWATLTDWPAHGRWVAGTRVRTTSAQPDGVGATFVARTGVGRLGFDDPMTVTVWQPPDGDRPGRCTVRKTGRVVLGEATFEVSASAPGRSRLDWSEDVELAGVRRLPGSAYLSRLVGGWVFGSVVRRMAREVESSASAAPPSQRPA
ncbi:SRPBCC family protein [Angustibacter sp. McL0619]|uniref:SRPBCC family protein n=1 Tax=Angustibacter sp. McL0619 TaxID=3415676 RepID=UPI003CF12B64